MKKNLMHTLMIFAVAMFFSAAGASAKPYYYQLRIYTLENEQQEAMMDDYLEHAYIPALHRAGIEDVGVFKTITGRNDGKQQIMVFIPVKSIKRFESLSNKVEQDESFRKAALEFRNASFEQPPYKRLETVLMKAFSGTPAYSKPELSAEKPQRVYELRSYESATEELHRKKVKMFNEGESDLFEELGFEPLFFGSVIAGANMPNLMYMTCHENAEAQTVNWDSFRVHPEWNRMKVLEEFQNTVSHSEKWMLYPAAYSDL